MQGGEIDRRRVGVKYMRSAQPPGGAHTHVSVCVRMHKNVSDI